jgi:hypothetical protein
MKWYSPLCVGLLFAGCQPFRAESDALLSETGAKYHLLSREGGMWNRTMYCDFEIAPVEVEKLVQVLGLGETGSNANSPTRVIHLSDGEIFDNPNLAKRVHDSFGHQLWVPSKHGFAGAFLIYDSKKGIGRLWLSIAYG